MARRHALNVHMDYGDYIDAVRADGAALASAAAAAGLETRVPSCPLWSVADLLGHIGRIHRWVAQLVATRAAERGPHWSEADPPAANELTTWFAGGVTLLADALEDAGPDAAVWSWTPDATSGFWARRQAHETSVHRYDAQLAARRSQSLDGTLAADGIDELFAVLPWWPGAPRVRGDGETVHLHCTDRDGEWLVELVPDGIEVSTVHAKGDVAARGSASDLLLFLYGRVGTDALDVFGDAAVLARFRELITW
jgi:uncharacterized protein (TIGR03083 family)